jgi:hypothetical protein
LEKSVIRGLAKEVLSKRTVGAEFLFQVVSFSPVQWLGASLCFFLLCIVLSGLADLAEEKLAVQCGQMGNAVVHSENTRLVVTISAEI